MTLRAQLLALFFAITFLTLLVVGALFLVFTSQFAGNLENEYLSTAVQRIEERLSDLEGRPGAAEFRQILENNSAFEDLDLRIFSDTGALLYRSSQPGPGAGFYRSRLFSAMQNRFGPRADYGQASPDTQSQQAWPQQDFSNGPPFGRPWNADTAIRSFPLGQLGYRVEFAAGSEVYSGILSEAFKGFAIAALVALALAALVAVLASRRLARPLLLLADKIGSLQPDSPQFSNQIEDLAKLSRKPSRNPVEVTSLLASSQRLSNRILVSTSQLAAERDSLRSFLANANHELRTPLTAASNYLSLASAQQPTGHLANLAGQLARMEAILSRLLHISRIDGGGYEVRLVAISLSDFLAESLRAAEAAFPQAKLEFVSTGMANIQVFADRTALGSLFQAIFENAFTHALDSANILRLNSSVELNSANQAIINISDSGPGFSPALLESFAANPLHPEKSATGLGLGLLIAYRSAQLCGGDLHISNAADSGHAASGALLRIHLPIAPQEPT